MIGTLLAIAIVFVILVVLTRSIGYFRGSYSIVGAEHGGEEDVRQSALLGAGAGLIVLLLVALLYLGVTRWEWFGHPVPRTPVLAAPKAQPSPALGGVGTSPAPGASASPAGSPSPSASPQP